MSGVAMGSGPSNNGFVASTANIDQSSKNTINVYQFGQGVNFNLKLAPGQANAQNMSRKQYEQIQNALNQMSSLEKQNVEEQALLGASGQIGLKNQISQPNSNTSNKQYPSVNTNGSSANPNFAAVSSSTTTSKRSSKMGNGQGSSQSSQRRKGNSQTINKNNFSNQYMTNAGTANVGLTSAQTNLMHTA